MDTGSRNFLSHFSKNNLQIFFDSLFLKTQTLLAHEIILTDMLYSHMVFWKRFDLTDNILK